MRQKKNLKRYIVIYLYMILNKQDLLMLWRFSRFESVREVAQNPDILKLILQELEPMFQYNRVVTRPGGSRLYSTWDRSYKCAFGAGKSEIGAMSASRLEGRTDSEAFCPESRLWPPRYIAISTV